MHVIHAAAPDFAVDLEGSVAITDGAGPSNEASPREHTREEAVRFIADTSLTSPPMCR